MLKRKYGDRSDWKRVLNREYAQSFIDTASFVGYVTLLRLVKVSEPIYVEYNGEKICIADDGYFWLQHFPLGHHHSVTTMFDSEGNIVQWYIDICSQNGVNEHGIPWMEDLFLDLIVLPSRELIYKDKDELEEALNSGVIDKIQYDLARAESAKLSELIKHNEFALLKLSEEHKDYLSQKLRGNL